MVTTSMPQWLQMLYKKLAQESEFDPLFDGDINIEEGALEINDNANRQETTAQEHRLLSLIATFCLGDK